MYMKISAHCNKRHTRFERKKKKKAIGGGAVGEAIDTRACHGLEAQRKLLYSPPHGHVIINGAWLQRKRPHP